MGAFKLGVTLFVALFVGVARVHPQGLVETSAGGNTTSSPALTVDTVVASGVSGASMTTVATPTSTTEAATSTAQSEIVTESPPTTTTVVSVTLKSETVEPLPFNNVTSTLNPSSEPEKTVANVSLGEAPKTFTNTSLANAESSKTNASVPMLGDTTAPLPDAHPTKTIDGAPSARSLEADDDDEAPVSAPNVVALEATRLKPQEVDYDEAPLIAPQDAYVDEDPHYTRRDVEEIPLDDPDLVPLDEAPLGKPKPVDRLDDLPLVQPAEMNQIDEVTDRTPRGPSYSPSDDSFEITPLDLVEIVSVTGKNDPQVRPQYEDSYDLDDNDVSGSMLKEVEESLATVRTDPIEPQQILTSQSHYGSDLEALLFPPARLNPTKVGLTQGWLVARESFLQAIMTPLAVAASMWPFGGAPSTSEKPTSPDFLNEEVIDGRPQLEQVLYKSKDQTHRSDGPNYVVPHLWDNRARPRAHENSSQSGYQQTNPGQVSEKLETCGAFLTDMSTSSCRRFEKYSLRACPNDTALCSDLAQRDLTQLMGMCSKPTKNLVCKMLFRKEPSAVCPHTICKVYEFSIGKVLDTSKKCLGQVLTLSNKLMG